MKNIESSTDDLKTIRKIMEESSRFLSLSGLSGVFAGLAAIIGAMLSYWVILDGKFILDNEMVEHLSQSGSSALRFKLISAGGAVLLFAIAASIFLSIRKAKACGFNIWSPVSKRLLLSFLVPLVSGGMFIIILLAANQWNLIVPLMLLFYGFALVSACKFTFGEIFYLGISEISVGLIGALLPQYAIIFWITGFGFLHIFYGLFMYRKYEG